MRCLVWTVLRRRDRGGCFEGQNCLSMVDRARLDVEAYLSIYGCFRSLWDEVTTLTMREYRPWED